MTGLKMVHVTYKGGPQALGDVMTGPGSDVLRGRAGGAAARQGG
jgi:hypothetical protein